jgi:nitrogen fixation protein FixH
LLATPAELIFDLNDREGKPIQGGQIVINAQWPGDPRFDFKGVLNEKSPGRYVGSLNFPRSGNWDLLIRATYEGRQFDMEQKVFVEIPKQP